MRVQAVVQKIVKKLEIIGLPSDCGVALQVDFATPKHAEVFQAANGKRSMRAVRKAIEVGSKG